MTYLLITLPLVSSLLGYMAGWHFAHEKIDCDRVVSMAEGNAISRERDSCAKRLKKCSVGKYFND